MFYLGAEK